MLEFIKKYRNNPDRTVLTMKCRRSFYILKRKDIVNCKNDSQNNDSSNKTGFKGENHSRANAKCGSDNHLKSAQKQPQSACNGYVLECENAVLSGNKDTAADVVAFKSNESFVDADACGFDEVLECDKYCKNNFDKEILMKENNKAAEKLKMKEKCSSGALVCEKTKRILLCDLISCLTLSIAALTVICKLVFKQK